VNLTRREFLKITGTGVFCLALSGCISKLPNVSTNIYDNMQIFSVNILHTIRDSDDGKEFIIPNFPKNCIIKEIRIRSGFISGQQNWRVAFVDNKDGIAPSDTEILCRTAEIFEIGDYIFIGDEIAYVIKSNAIKNMITVKRGVKGTIPMYHNGDTRMETANNGLRILLFNNRYKRLVDSLIMENIICWKGTTRSFIREDDNYIRLIDSPININKYDTIYIKDISNSERVSVIGTNGIAENKRYGNIIYTKDPLLYHFPGAEVQKQTIYNIPIIYTGEENNLYGLLYIDEKIDEEITVNIEIVVIEQTDALR